MPARTAPVEAPPSSLPATASTLKATGKDGGRTTDVEQTLVASFAENQRGEVLESPTMGSLKTGGGKPGQSYPAVRTGATVRRLTPNECEALMGWPQGWTIWPGNAMTVEDL